FGRSLQVGAVHDEAGVLAPQLHEAGLDPAGRETAMDSQPHGLGTGEHHAVDALVAPQVVADLLAPSDDIVEGAGRQTRIAIQLVQLEPRPGSIFRRLEYDGVAR